MLLLCGAFLETGITINIGVQGFTLLRHLIYFLYICNMWITNRTYEQAGNGSMPTDYWTQTTTWDEDFNPKTSAEN